MVIEFVPVPTCSVPCVGGWLHVSKTGRSDDSKKGNGRGCVEDYAFFGNSVFLLRLSQEIWMTDIGLTPRVKHAGH